MPSFHIAQSTESRHLPPDATVTFDLGTDDRSSPSAILLGPEGQNFTFSSGGSYRFDFFAHAVPYTDVESALVRFESPSFPPFLQDSFGTARVEGLLVRGRLSLSASTILPLEAGQILRVRLHLADKFLLEEGARLMVTRVA